MNNYTLDAQKVKSLIKGNEAYLYHKLAGIDARLLDGRGHPCPLSCQCGTDRFNYNKDTGKIYCRQCSPRGVSIFDAVMQYSRCDFYHSLAMVSDELGIASTESIAVPPVVKDIEPPAKNYGTEIPPLDEVYAGSILIRNGEPDVTYTYRSITGEPLYDIFRWNKSATRSKKLILPDRLGLTARNRTLYGMDKLVNGDGIILHEGERCVDSWNTDWKTYQQRQTGTTFQWTATTAGGCTWSQVYKFALENVSNFPAFYKNNRPKPLIIVADDDKNGTGADSADKILNTIFEPLGFLGKVHTLYADGTGKDYADFSDENADPISRLIELGILTLNNN